MFLTTKHSFFSKPAILAGCLVLFSSQTVFAETLDINTGESQSNLVIESGGTYDHVNINDQGTATDTTVNNGGILEVNTGGTAEKTTVNGGEMTVNSGGTANDTTVKSGGILTATESSATLNGVTIEDDGRFELSTSATVTDLKDGDGNSMGSIQGNAAQNIIINENSSLIVTANSSASGSKINGGGIIVSGTEGASGGKATNTTISNNGFMSLEKGGSADTVTVNGEGSVNVENSSSVTAATLTGSDADHLAALTVENGGSAKDTTINNFGEATINSGGSTTNTTVNNGGILNIAGGTAETTTVNDGGTIKSYDNNSKINDVTLKDGGKFDFSTNATVTNIKDSLGNSLGKIENNTAEGFVIGNGSNLTVDTGGTANNTTVNAGGNITATASGSTIDNITLNEGGTFNFSTNSSVNNIKNSDGSLSYSTIADKTASNFQVTEGSTLTAESGGTITTTGVAGGTVVAKDGGTVTNTTVGDNGIIRAEAGSTITETHIVTSTGGKFDFSTGATVTDSSINGNNVSIVDNTAAGFEISEGSNLSVDENGFSNDTIVSGGTLNVNQGGTAYNTEITSGTAAINGGAALGLNAVSGVVNITNGGHVSVYDNPETGITNDVLIIQTGVVNVSENGSIENAQIGDGGQLNIAQNGSAFSSTVQNGGLLDVSQDGQSFSSTIEEGGHLKVHTGGSATNVIVESGGNLSSESNGTVVDLVAEKGSHLDLTSGTVLEGGLTLDSGADFNGSFNLSDAFAEGSRVNSLTLTDGFNSAFNGSVINNDTSENKSLTLKDGNFLISDSGQEGAAEIGGWNEVVLASDATARWESDVSLSGSTKNFVISNGATLDVSGTLENAVNVTLGGNLINSGTIDFTKQSDNAADTVTINGDYTGEDGSRLVMNVNPKDNSVDKLHITGDVHGSSEVYLLASSSRLPEGNLLYAEADGNTSGTADSFNIWRVEGSPFNWETLFENNKWYAYVTDGDSPTIVPETAAYYGLIDNTFMQTASLGANLRNNIAENELHKIPCRLPGNLKYSNRICRSSRPLFTGWAAPVYSSSTIKAPYNYKASIAGLDGGLDLVSDGHTKFGLLGSYRSGSYKYQDSGETYTLKGSAETQINSYLGGAYIRHDGSSWTVIVAAYGGILDADISSDDGVDSDTSGTTYGATLDVSYIYRNISGFKIEPGVRISYTSVSLDELDDNAGKRQEFDTATRNEIEAGIKFAQHWEFPTAKAEIFFKPSVVQITNDSGAFELIEGRELDSTEDRTLAKIESGMSFDMIGNMSASLAASYSFGSDYENISAGLSLIYNF